MEKVVDAAWGKIRYKVIGFIKVFILKNHIQSILSFFYERLKIVTFKYCKHLPLYVIESEGDDLKTVAQLELIEAIKSWDPINNDELWPLAQMRIVGAMKDHIRAITKSDPSRVYDWVKTQGQNYISNRTKLSQVDRYDLKDQIKSAMKHLNSREQFIVYAHTKLDLTFKVIGTKIKLSESQVSRVYKKSMQTLKKVIEDEMNK